MWKKLELTTALLLNRPVAKIFVRRGSGERGGEGKLRIDPVDLIDTKFLKILYLILKAWNEDRYQVDIGLRRGRRGDCL